MESHGFNPIWDIGVFDAHCHPTDIMDSVGRIPKMRARALTVMSTRAQDQELVEQTAAKMGVRCKCDLMPGCSRSHTGGADDGVGAGTGAAGHDGGAEGGANVDPRGDLVHDDGRAGGHDRNVHLHCDGDRSSFQVIPAFGWHPWFSHQLWDDRKSDTGRIDANEHYKTVIHPVPDAEFLKGLEHPLPLTRFLRETEQRLEKYPLALVGEIGLDKSFRIPEGPSSMKGDVNQKTGGDEGAYTPGSREGRPLTPYKVNMEQQKMILKAQLQLAAKHRRPVSVHSVQAHGVVFEVMQSLWKGHERLSKRQQKKQRDAPYTFDSDDTNESTQAAPQDPPYPPRICMHSFSGPAETLKLFLDPKIPAEMYISFSECINFNSPSWKKAVEAIKLVPDDKILVESDLHCAGTEMDKLLEDIVRKVCAIKEWNLEQGAKILKNNWFRFIFGE